LEQLGEDPYAGDVEKLDGRENVWRRRVGSYRIFYELSVAKRTVFIFKIERRTSATY